MPSPEAAIAAAIARAPAACGLRDEQRREPYVDARRAMEICNACRYCEGFCAVFPAMTRRRHFEDRDLDYLANLCHGCRSCYYSCQYAPPHEFGINVPRAFADLRLRSYEKYCWPISLGKLFRRGGPVMSCAISLGIALAVTTAAALLDASTLTQRSTGDFYAIVPHGLMVALAGGAFLFALVAVTAGGVRFWRDIAGRTPVPRRAVVEAIRDVMTLRNLGAPARRGCNDRDERFSNLRRRFHHAMFYGFLLCFAATSVATVYDYVFGWKAPYPLLSWPVQLGLWGGLGMLVGAAGLAWLKRSGDRGPMSPGSDSSDRGLLVMLALIALTGLLLLALRATSCLGVLLVVHLGLVVTFFLLIPYSKMVHGVYRSLALLYSAIEQRHG